MQEVTGSAKLAEARLRQALRIKQMLALKGLTLADIDRQFDLSNGTARNTLREPNAAGEGAISAALAVEPETLWPDRYAGGQRKSPQDYSRPPTLAQRRKKVAA